MNHIIFDIGNVLLNYQPLEYLNKYYSKDISEDLYKIIFQSPEWIELDKGTIPIQEVINILSLKYPKYNQEIELILNHWTDMMTPITKNVEIAKKLKQNGYHLYLLSNFHKVAFDQMIHKYDFFQLFDGQIISSHVHLLKPNKDIYIALLNKYDLQPQDCLFIDDTRINTLAAMSIRIKTIYLPYQNDLKQELTKLNINI